MRAAYCVHISIDSCSEAKRTPLPRKTRSLQRAEREFINRRTLRLWAPTWFRMVGNNLFACKLLWRHTIGRGRVRPREGLTTGLTDGVVVDCTAVTKAVQIQKKTDQTMW